MVIMDKVLHMVIMGNKKVLQKLKILEVSNYYHDLPTNLAQSNVTTHFPEE
jgi:hypothetical protein